MFRLFEFIVFLLLGYKLLRLLFEGSPSPKPQQTQQRQDFSNHNHYQSQGTSTPSPDKFDDAEFIDYEEVK
jgi:hypothetical protein